MGLIAKGKILVREVKSWTWHHAVMWLITFFVYAVYHATRKAFSNVKNLMAMSLSPHGNSTMFPYDTWQKERMFSTAADANVFFGELDLLFMLAYAIGLFISGVVGDRFNLRYMLTIGMCGSSIMTFLFGYLYVPCHIQNKMYFRCFVFLNGLFQSTGWPATVAIVANWFDKSSSGLVFGIWSSNSNLGNVFGSLLVTSVIDFGYEYGMLLNSILSLALSIIVFTCLIPHPNEIGIKNNKEVTTTTIHVDVDDDAKDIEMSPTMSRDQTYPVANATDVTIQPEVDTNMKAISFWEACLIPGVLSYSFSFACLKMVTYAFFFWLPTYLTQRVHWQDKTSDKLSNFYEIGGITGSIMSGVISDLLGLRAPVVSSMLLLAIISLYLYDMFGNIYSVNCVLMVTTGIMLAGPAGLITTVISADLGKHDKIAGNTKALSTVSGIIDGTGSLGAALGQYIVGLISKYCGWKWVFKFLISMVAMSFILISPILYKELKSVWKSRNVVEDDNKDAVEDI